MKNTLSEVKWYTPKQVAEILSVSEKTIRRRFCDRAGVYVDSLPVLRSRRTRAPRTTIRISQEALDKFLAERSGGFELQPGRRAVQ